jgi:hypothetical protein
MKAASVRNEEMELTASKRKIELAHGTNEEASMLTAIKVRRCSLLRSGHIWAEGKQASYDSVVDELKR